MAGGVTESRTENWDVVIIGSGINALVAATLLGRRGRRVLVLEREGVAGGCIRTDELTLPGFRHDTLSTLYPLFVTAPHFALLKDDLARHGARFVNGPAPTAVLTDGGDALVFRTDREANAAAFEARAAGDGAAYRAAMAEIEANAPLIFALLGGELWTWKTARLLLGEARRRGIKGLARFFGTALTASRDWLATSFRDGLSRSLFAPWVLHVGLAPESAASALMNKLVLFTLEQAGAPMVEGGSARIVEAFSALIAEQGGAVRTGADVAEILVERGRATGVRLASGETIAAARAVAASVTPGQLYQRLLARAAVEDVVREEARLYRHGRGEMQIHLALAEPPHWPDPALNDVAMLHLVTDADATSRAVNEAERGLLPAAASIVVAQPTAIDPTRAPPGRSILWIQLQEVPRDGEVKGDALETIAVPADGRWTPELREAYADRIVDRLCAVIPNLRAAILARHAISPADLAALNINLVGGDPYGGACTIDQFMLWRPAQTPGRRETAIRGLFHIGASTHPGPGLGGVSGMLAAEAIG